jgi:hypothetical protein
MSTLKSSEAMTASGQLNKKVIHEYVEFNCQRQLFLNMGEQDPRWVSPVRKLAKGSGPVRTADLLLKMGREYEQDVYARLLHTSNLDVRASRGRQDHVVPTPISARGFAGLHASMMSSKAHRAALLLEYEWKTPRALLTWMLGIDEGSEIPVANPSQYCRPDIMMCSKRQGFLDRALQPDGTALSVPREDARLAIHMIDIKHTNPEDIGKKQFIELLFYAHAMAIYLRDHGLDDRFFVSLDGHGIWPLVNLNTLTLDVSGDLHDALVEMIWDNHVHLFTLCQEAIQELHELAPLAIEDVDLRIQPACARCRFVHDCKASMHWTPELTHHGDVDIRLLPCTSSSTAEQLRDLGIETIGDLDARQDALIAHTHIPSPLYAERPLLRLKARAMVTGHKVFPEMDDPHALRHISMAIPKYANVVMTFNAEADPTNDCVFAFGTSLDLRCGAHSPYVALHDAWWARWKHELDTHYAARLVDLDAMLDLFTQPQLDYFLELDQALTQAQLLGRLRTRLKLFAQTLWKLKRHGQLDITLSSKWSEQARVTHSYAFISQGPRPSDERRLVDRMVEQFQSLITMTTIYEECVFVTRRDEQHARTYQVAPQSAIFYWSHDQLEHVQSLMERHLTELLTDPAICGSFHELLQLINPSESSVQQDFLHKKIYDLRRFVETSVGIPQIINYTWHEIASRELASTPKFSATYWASNFNYMDFLAWHTFLISRDPSQATPLINESARKARVIAQLVRHFRAEGNQRELISHQARPIPSREIPWRAHRIDASVNFLARAWALYSKLTATVQEQDALTARLNFPAYSIGKLLAAEVTDLIGQEFEKDKPLQRFSFTLKGVSSNIKMGEGSYMLLVHEKRRDSAISDYSGEQIIIDSMEWDGAQLCYRVTAHARRDSHPYFVFARSQEDAWYLYPTASDSWSGKLFEQKHDTLFRRYELGTSWLGTRLAGLLHLLPIDVPVPTRREQGYVFSTQEMYTYAANLLGAAPKPLETSLLTRAYPAPDDSQREAIRLALAQPVSCIQGPPGTGKSQTIATLIDEFLARRVGQPTRILVASFSYVPLNVVLEKVCAQRDEEGQPTRAASIQKIFMRADYRDPVDKQGVSELVRRGSKLWLDEVAVPRKRGAQYKDGYSRLEDALDESFVLCAPAQQLFHLGAWSSSKSMHHDWLHNDFGFDLIIIDEASQMPVDQALTSLCLVKPGRVALAFDAHAQPASGDETIERHDVLDAMHIASMHAPDGQPMSYDELTRVVIVGDHNQLPPVQQVDISEKLRPVLGSLFEFYVRSQSVPSHQLTINYRSSPAIVGYTRHLQLYERDIQAFHQGVHAHPSLPAVPPDVQGSFMEMILSPERVVTSLIHEEKYQTAISELEATVVTHVVCAFYRQLGIQDAPQERAFWREELGIVAPHNAQGRLIIRSLASAFTRPEARLTTLSDAELEAHLTQTIYSVEKFQGSARTFIIASVGISDPNQLAAEETFIYDINRLNVLTSRARQKMLMICSRQFLDYTPRSREMVPAAARFRDYALVYCNQRRGVALNLNGQHNWVQVCWHDPDQPLARLARPINAPRVHEPEEHDDIYGIPEHELRQAVSAVGLDYDSLDEAHIVQFATQIKMLRALYAESSES